MNFLSQETKGSLYAILSGFLYSLLGYFGKSLATANFSVYNMLFWRFLISGLLIFIILLFKSKDINENAADVLKMLLYGSAFYSVSGIMYFLACDYINTGFAMVIFFTYPAIIMLLSWMLYRTRPTKLYYLAVAIMLVGLALLADFTGARLSVTGISLAIVAAVSYSSYILLSKKVKISPLIATLMVSVGCAITCLILTLATHSFMMPSNAQEWVNVFGFGIVCTALPIVLLLEALKKISSVRASLLSVLEPVFVIIFGILLLNEEVNLIQMVGVITMLCGASIALLSNTKASITINPARKV